MIFPFWKRKSAKGIGVMPRLTVDVHSHLIPGIDDGARDLEESLEILRVLQKVGYRKVITTPHIMADSYPNNASVIYQGLKQLKDAAREEKIDVVVEVAAEYYLDEYFMEKMAQEEVLAVSNRYVLFETSYTARPLQMEAMIFAVREAGYEPMLAHPERYRYIAEPEKEYGRLKELGVYFQVNLNSFGGYYGKQAKAMAHFLSQKGMIDFLGSDIHHLQQAETLAAMLTSRSYRRIWQNNHIKNNEL